MKATIAATQPSGTGSRTEHSHQCPPSSPGFAQPSACPCHPRQAFHLRCSFAIYLMVSVTTPGSRQQWEVQNSFLSPPGNVGEVLYILHVWRHLVYGSMSGTYIPEQWEQLRHPQKPHFQPSTSGQFFSLQKCLTVLQGDQGPRLDNKDHSLWGTVFTF